MKKIKIYVFFVVLGVSYGCISANKDQHNEVENPEFSEVHFNGTLKVLSLNTWHEGELVDGGFDAIVDIILQTEVDVIILCEIRNSNNIIFSNKITDELKKRGEDYYSFNSGKSPIVLSKFPIVSKPVIDNTSLTKCIVKLNETLQVALYAAHLDYTHYACYLPRGYDGITWKKLPEPVLDVSKILLQNKASSRDEAIELFVKDASVEKENGNLVLLAGDFNEPSHLDWTMETKDLFDHNGTVVPWHNSITLKENNYVDAYRMKYPNPTTHPGFTWAAYNIDVELSKLVWTPDADDRDRIDFIYYNNDSRFTLEDIIVVGPSGSIVNGQGIQDNSLLDKFLLPQGKWPSDHKGLLATFRIN
ncbi:endonuclease/exonuclease/phosphatase family protein [Flavivirga spongiicola]|uniref:Endonuclease/exonuclease/phosphatase family protein n=1 Tax=Flavivirga spongiicola TaxID=421621 RepID=A0ABU7XRN3_9FLAO|nr:endonuclease/exonuclease/phosphatase family protein [Flavivirga sp. MEBiC05379]MDO5978236.1 endonuclease/exonuclease/phosphatase family protein [Flavivirga sp. MEBiC05379]